MEGEKEGRGREGGRERDLSTHLSININIITDQDIITYQKKLTVIYILLFIVKIHKNLSMIIIAV